MEDTMEFKDKFREAYRVVLHAARDNNRQGTIDGFTNLCKLMDNQ